MTQPSRRFDDNQTELGTPILLCQSLTRAFGILETLAQAGRELGMKEISEQTRLNISTVFRLIQTMEECNLVERNRETRKYRMGLKVLSWGTRVLQSADLARQAAPFLEELNKKTRETVHLTVRDGDAGVYVYKLDSPIPLRIYSEIGKRAPLYCTGVGKVLLAAMPKHEREDWLKRNALQRCTPNTITDKTKLEREIAKIDRLGYALDNEEHEPHVKCAAAPIYDYTGRVIAAISVTVPSVRMAAKRVPELVHQVKDAAQKLSVQLGFGVRAAATSSAARAFKQQGAA